MIAMVHKPLAAWLKTIMQGVFKHPKSSDACDMTAEAVVLALRDTIGNLPAGKAVLKRIALDILENDK
jgi:hypothetical protein